MSGPRSRTAAIELRGVSKSFKVGAGTVHALRNAFLTIAEGEFVAITGPSGSGKTTLLEILGCLSNPSCGEYSLFGVRVKGLRASELSRIRREKIGFVFQTFNLLPRLTALENVELPLVYRRVGRSRRRRIAQDALEGVGLEKRVSHYPTRLSGGECQRVAIARALVGRPRLILADEPTGNLDSRTGSEILEVLESLNAQGRSIVLVTHDTGIASRADRVLTIRDGSFEHAARAAEAAR